MSTLNVNALVALFYMTPAHVVLSCPSPAAMLAPPLVFLTCSLIPVTRCLHHTCLSFSGNAGPYVRFESVRGA